MIKIAVILAVIVICWRWALGEWPWHYLQNSKKPKSKLNRPNLNRARLLLGVSPQADATQIRDAHRKLANELHPDKGGSDARLAEINAARDLLIADADKQGNE